MHLVPYQHSLSAPGGGYIEWGQKSKSKKFPMAFINLPQKIRGSNINPPKKSHAKFPSLKVWLFLFAELHGWDMQELP